MCVAEVETRAAYAMWVGRRRLYGIRLVGSLVGWFVAFSVWTVADFVDSASNTHARRHMCEVFICSL